MVERRSSGAEWRPFLRLATLTLVVAILGLAQEVLIPIALAGVIAFALNPGVKALERRVGRGLSVALVVLVALGAVSGFGYLLKRQITDLSLQMTKYSDSMVRKVAALRGSDDAGISGLSRTLQRVAEGVDHRVTESREPPAVKIVEGGSSGLDRFAAILTPVVDPIARSVLVLVLVVFLLTRREDFRDRVIRLVGRTNVTLTTRTLDEAGHRISTYLSLQSAINAGFGVAIAIGLALIGIPYPLLWAVTAAVLRFVPYVGMVLAMCLPALIAFAQFPGWWPTVATLGLFLGANAVADYVAEPMLIGRKTGVSSMAMLVMAVFWTWLWGPIGLVLSTPLTVCLVAVGKQVPALAFLNVLLGDEPALEPELTFYQRLLAGDEDEAGDILEKRLRATSRLAVFDDVVVPALVLAEKDRARAEIGENDHALFVRTAQAVVASVDEPKSTTRDDRSGGAGRTVLGVAARGTADELVWQLLRQLIDPRRASVESVGAAALASEASAAVVAKAPDVVCVVALPPGGLAQARYLCRRIRAGLPGIAIVVVRPLTSTSTATPTSTSSSTSTSVDADTSASAKLIEDGALVVVPTIAEALVRIEQQLLLVRVTSEAAG